MYHGEHTDEFLAPILAAMDAEGQTADYYAEQEEKRRGRREYSCYVTRQNVANIAERVRNLFLPHRMVTMVRRYGQDKGHPDITPGLSLARDCIGDPVTVNADGVGVLLAPRICGFGVWTAHYPDLRTLHAHQRQAKQRRKQYQEEHGEGTGSFFRDPECDFVEITGGLAPDSGDYEDRVRVTHLNEHGVTEFITFSFDLERWHDTVHREAVLLAALAKLPGADVEWLRKVSAAHAYNGSPLVTHDRGKGRPVDLDDAPRHFWNKHLGVNPWD